MHHTASYLLVTVFAVQTLYQPLFGHQNEQHTFTSEMPSQNSEELTLSQVPLPQETKPQKPFTAFTARTLKNKVRIRIQPTLDSPILREINKGELFVVLGETEEFYALQAPSDVKGYVFRTYILDNVVEGNRVNIRLEPSLEAPIIAQLNAGDTVNGQISALNNKWLEITPPDSTRFYIAKEYIEKIGNADLKSILDQKREEGTKLLNNTFAESQTELLKPWNQINLDKINGNLNKIIKDYSDFPELQTKAKELLTMIQETYFQKKIVYLEALAKNTDYVSAQNKELANKVTAQEQRINELEQKPATPVEDSVPSLPPASNPNSANPMDKMNAWLPVENQLYENWAEVNENQPIAAFYDDQLQKATTLKGVIQVYDRAVRNKPGDYVLLNPTTRIPIAYLYSTQINLQDYNGKEVTVKVVPRENNNFAYPAYFVLVVE